MTREDRKPLFWIGSSRRDLKEFPEEVLDAMGHALDIAQQGKKHQDAKPLSGFGGASILEIVENHDGDTYRAVYPDLLGDLVVDVGGRHHRFGAFDAGLVLQSAVDSVLASGELAMDTGVHLKTSW